MNGTDQIHSALLPYLLSGLQVQLQIVRRPASRLDRGAYVTDMCLTYVYETKGVWGLNLADPVDSCGAYTYTLLSSCYVSCLVSFIRGVFSVCTSR